MVAEAAVNRIKVRLHGFLVDSGSDFNIPLFSIATDGYALSLSQCSGCGELFVSDFENPATSGKSLQNLGQGKRCPVCGSDLAISRYAYPRQFRTPSGGMDTLDSVPIHEGPGEIVSLYALEPQD